MFTRVEESPFPVVKPMAQPDFVEAIMKAMKSLEIHTALDTCGHAPWEDFQRVLPFTDLVYA